MCALLRSLLSWINLPSLSIKRSPMTSSGPLLVSVFGLSTPSGKNLPTLRITRDTWSTGSFKHLKNVLQGRGRASEWSLALTPHSRCHIYYPYRRICALNASSLLAVEIG
uniref:Uncharacterized protein n=1 Tax=Opuntia streptacantha TaxID=393608 RepID=A0A7C9DYJ7_OPUST